MNEVLDPRFFVEYFYSTDATIRRQTDSKLRLLIKQNRGILPTIVISELVKLTCERKGKEVAQLRYLSLVRSGLRVADLTADVAEKAGLLKCVHKNLPYGDCIIAATTLLSHAKIITDDPHFSAVNNITCAWLT